MGLHAVLAGSCVKRHSSAPYSAIRLLAFLGAAKESPEQQPVVEGRLDERLDQRRGGLGRLIVQPFG